MGRPPFAPLSRVESRRPTIARGGRRSRSPPSVTAAQPHSPLQSRPRREPALLRTDVYHEVLLGYIEDLKNRGFNSLTLWSCPPQKGDQYIINAPP